MLFGVLTWVGQGIIVLDGVPYPAGGAHDAPPDPLVGWGGGHPLPRLYPIGASLLAHSALATCSIRVY